MSLMAAVLVCLLLGILTVFQVFLVLGAPWGRFAWGGRHRVLPGPLRVGSLLSMVIYAMIAAVVLARAEIVSSGIPDGVVSSATWVIVAYFLLGVGLNLASRSKPERAVMAPLSAVLCALCAVVATS